MSVFAKITAIIETTHPMITCYIGFEGTGQRPVVRQSVSQSYDKYIYFFRHRK